MERTPRRKHFLYFQAKKYLTKVKLKSWTACCPMETLEQIDCCVTCSDCRNYLESEDVNPGTFFFLNIQKHFLVILLKFKLSHHQWITEQMLCQSLLFKLTTCAWTHAVFTHNVSPKSESVEAPVKMFRVTSRTSGWPSLAPLNSVLVLECVTYFTVTFSLVCVSVGQLGVGGAGLMEQQKQVLLKEVEPYYRRAGSITSHLLTYE